MIDCPSEGRLALLLSGDLPEPEAQPVREHLAGCAVCSATLDRLTEVEGLGPWRPFAATTLGRPDSGPALDRLLARLRTPTDLDAEGDPAESARFGAGGRPGSIGPYPIEAELGRGGMGVVYLGRDPALGRRVAIKVLHAWHPDARARLDLVREARLAASFRHDNAVTVHALVEPPDGPPYLVMEHVDGPTLAARVRSDHPLDRRLVAGWIAEVAGALAAAHAAGLIHRDVKPSNILIDPETGRARLADFGLARMLEPAPGDSATAESALAGTPTYMSPEQARGRGPLEARSDVYGLGVTLYEALTGEVPFRGAPPMVLRQVLDDDPRAPRALDDSIPRDLETICRKAMAKEPTARYASASEVADDLRRWLAGEPIRARPLGPLGRLRSWALRKPVVAALTMALASALVLGVAGMAWQWREAERQRRHAEENFVDAMAAVDRLLSRVAEVNLASEPGFLPIRRDLYKSAREFYEKFARDRADDPALRVELGRALYHQAGLTVQLGSAPEALEILRQALAIQESRHSERPGDRASTLDLARSLLRLGDIYTYLGRPKDSEAALARVVGLMRPVAGDGRGSVVEVVQFGVAGMSLGAIRAGDGRPALARSDYRTAEVAVRAALVVHPEAARLRSLLAGIVLNQSELDRALGEADAALSRLGEVLGLLGAMPPDDPAPVLTRSSIALALGARASLRAIRGDVAGASDDHDRTVAIAREILEMAPAVSLNQSGAAMALSARAEFLGTVGRLDDGLRDAEESRSILERLLKKAPNSGPTLAALAGSSLLIGRLQFQLGRAADAINSEGRCLDEVGRSRKLGPPGSRALDGTEAVARFNRGSYLVDSGRLAEGADELGRAIAIGRLSDSPLFRSLQILARARAEGRDPSAEVRDLCEPAAVEADEIASRGPMFGFAYYMDAGLFARASRVVLDDPKIPQAERPARSDRLAGRALYHLGKARDAGYFRAEGRVDRLRTDPELAPIRDRDDFRRFVDELTPR